MESGRSLPIESFTEEVELAEHIIDSLLLPKVLDEIMSHGGRFEILDISVGQRRQDPSAARLLVSAGSAEQLEKIVRDIGRHGAVQVHQQDAQLVAADIDGAFPEGFFCSTNQETQVRINGEWHRVDRPEMDCGLVVREGSQVSTLPMADVKLGDLIVVGHHGTRVLPQGRDRDKLNVFGFMQSTVSSEKPKNVTVREIAAEMRRAKQGDGKILVVAGPAVVHTGSREHLSRLIREGYVHLLFAGNALATHDIEQSFFGTSLGISMASGGGTAEGHEHHLRSINRIRRLGSIQCAVESGVLTDGIMYECVKHDVPFVLAGSIRDDGPLPDVITDSLVAQTAMRELIHAQGITFCLMIATTLHSIAVGNLLPASVKTVCVDINPATVTKLADRGTFQSIGLVTDVEPFLRVLVDELSSLVPSPRRGEG
jgi:lysine-ketoglutarate reductase/saccharopine dehydrogenase-like protein (TIGR00300 family)